MKPLDIALGINNERGLMVAAKVCCHKQQSPGMILMNDCAYANFFD
jgi:hypothetical protein